MSHHLLGGKRHSCVVPVKPTDAIALLQLYVLHLHPSSHPEEICLPSSFCPRPQHNPAIPTHFTSFSLLVRPTTYIFLDNFQEGVLSPLFLFFPMHISPSHLMLRNYHGIIGASTLTISVVNFFLLRFPTKSISEYLRCSTSSCTVRIRVPVLSVFR